jgi:hypothetical protein
VNSSVTSLTGIITLNNSSLGLRYGGVYNVRIDANYALTNGLGQADPIITVLGNSTPANCQNIPMMQQPLIEVKSTQVCPTVLLRTNNLLVSPVTGSPNVCGLVNYTFEFTRVSNCMGTTVIGSPFTVNSTGTTASLALSAAFPAQLGSTGYWSVRVRPNFSNNYPGVWGPSKVIAVSGSAASQMLDESAGTQQVKTFEAQPLSVVYPNPNNGSFTVKAISEGTYYLMNEAGQLVKSFTVNADNNFTYQIENLTIGFYVLSGQNKEGISKQKIVVTN